MKCPFCGYELSPIDPDCPRCLATEQREAALDAPRFRNPRIEVNDLPRATTPQVIDRSKIPAIAEVLRKGSLLLYVLCGALFLTSFFLPWFSLLDYIHASFTGQGEAREFFCLAALGAMGLALFEVKRKWPCLRYARLVLTGSCLTFAIWQLSELLPCSGQLRVELGLPLMIGGAAAMALLDVVSLPSKIIAIACVPLSILGIQSLSNRAETGGRHKMVVRAVRMSHRMDLG